MTLLTAIFISIIIYQLVQKVFRFLTFLFEYVAIQLLLVKHNIDYATLIHISNKKKVTILVFKTLKDPQTGLIAPSHCCAVVAYS